MKFRPFSMLLALLVIWSGPAIAEKLTLQECLARADRQSPVVRAEFWTPRIAWENVRQADSALFPRIDGQGGYTLQQSAQAVRINGFTAETQEPRYAFGGLAATYTLYDFGRREARRDQARLQADAAENIFASLRTDISLQVIEAYFGILQAGSLISSATEEVAQVEQHRRMAQALYEEGSVTRNDVLQAEVRLATARQNLLARSNLLENGWLRLNYLTGTPSGFRGELDDSARIDGNDTGNEAGDPLERRHELLALRQQFAAAEAGVKESRSSFFPELYTRLALDYLENDRVREQTIMSATFGVRVNLFDGFASTSARERAVQIRSQVHDRLRQAKMQMQLEIDTAANDVRVARERIAVAEAAIRQGEENLRINRERYQERVGTATDVLDAQTLLTQIRTDHFRAIFDYQVASAHLKRARGEL